jgi:Flp pilus assembly pilin Flp
MAWRFGRVLRDERGIAALEYALIAGLIFAAVLGANHLYGPQLKQAMTNLGTSLTIRDLGT